MKSSVFSSPTTHRSAAAVVPKQTVGRSVAEIPTLFRLGKIDSGDREADDPFDAGGEKAATGWRKSVRGKSVRPRAVRRRAVRRRAVQRTAGRQDADRRLRIDAAESPCSALPVAERDDSSPIEQRLRRLVHRTRRRSRGPDPADSVAVPTGDHVPVDDLLAAHSGDLITQLGVWSLHLDHREAGLDQRERELNARLRVWRQIQSHSPGSETGLGRKMTGT